MFENKESMDLLVDILLNYMNCNSMLYMIHYNGKMIFDLMQKGKLEEFKNDKYFIIKEWEDETDDKG